MGVVSVLFRGEAASERERPMWARDGCEGTKRGSAAAVALSPAFIGLANTVTHYEKREHRRT